MKIYITKYKEVHQGILVFAICEDGKILWDEIVKDILESDRSFGITSHSHRTLYDRYCGKDNWSISMLPSIEKLPKKVRNKNILLRDPSKYNVKEPLYYAPCRKCDRTIEHCICDLTPCPFCEGSFKFVQDWNIHLKQSHSDELQQFKQPKEEAE